MLRGACLAGSVVLGLATASLIAARIGTPFDNEWVESSIAASARRVMEGHSLYPSPSVEYVGDNYPPLYFHLCAGLMHLFGASRVVCRALSLAATVAIALALWNAGGGPAARRGERAVLVGLFVAFYAAGGQAYDLARVDMTALAPAAWAVVFAVRARGRRGAAVAGALMGLAILTKHNMVLLGATLGLGWWIVDRRRALIYALPALGLPVVVFGVLQVVTDGWSGYYLFTQPALHPFGGAGRWLRFLVEDAGAHGLVMAIGLAACGAILLRGRAWNAERRRTAMVLLAAAGGVLVTLAGRLKAGGFSNNLVPAWAFGLMAVAWMAPRVERRLSAQSPAVAGWFARGFWPMVAVMLVSLGWRFAALPWGRTFAMEERRQAIEALGAVLNRYGRAGPVWMPWHSFGADSGGGFAHLCPAGFLMNSSGRRAKPLFEADLARHLARRTWSAILVDDLSRGFVSPRCTGLLRQGYQEIALPVPGAENLTALTGKQTRPRRLWVRCDRPVAPRTSVSLPDTHSVDSRGAGG